MSPLIPYSKALALIGLGRSSGYSQAGDTLTAPVSVGTRAMMTTIEADVQRLARVAEFTKPELRELVAKLTAARQALASDDEVREILQTMQARRLAHGTNLESDKAARSEAARALVARRERVPA